MTVALASLLAACGSGADSPRAGAGSRVSQPPTSAVGATTSVTTGVETVAPPATVPPTTGTTPAAASTSPADAAPEAAPGTAWPVQLDRVGSSGQAVVVTASDYGDTSAVLSAYERSPEGWRLVHGPFDAYVGYNGFAPPEAKFEGDGRTPSGVYGFDFFLGVGRDPGVRFPYRQVTSESIVWDDDPSSPLYNTWVDENVQDVGEDPEEMYQPTAYEHAAVIAYNSARTPGLGSAIFLHASTGEPTAGCVSLPVDQLREVMVWLDPARQPRIILGVEEA
ncbi:MAG: L,D-transpeptidase family protein [Actinobacteria bacterium]|nr:L,D-transpeptidase family protein [Actinomycetota bacterium]